MRARMKASAIVGAAALGVLLGCGEGGEAGPRPEPPPEPVVSVWFSQGEALEPVHRPDLEHSPEAALRALAAGPTPDEQSRGLSSWFGESTRGAVSSVQLEEDGRAIIDFRQSLPQSMPGAGSSAGSAALLGALDSTLFQFPEIREIEYRLDGSCEAFWNWLQRECAIVTR